MSSKRERHRVVIDPPEIVSRGQVPGTIHVIDGNGKAQRGGYVWIGPRKRGVAWCVITRKRDLRALRDALNKLLPE